MTNNKNNNTRVLKEKIQAWKLSWTNKTENNIRKRKVMTFAGSGFRTIILIGMIFIIMLPIFQKFTFALRHPMDIANPQVVWIPETFSTINFQIAYQLLDFGHSVWNTIILSFASMLIQVFSSAIAGYAFARLKFKGNNIIFFFLIITLIIPNETLHISRMLFLTNTPFLGINLMGNIFSIYIMSAFGQGIRSAIFVYLFRQFFRNLPTELEESAQVDGAGVIRTFWSVMLPNARGAITTVALFSFVWQWNDYYFANLFKLASSGFPVFSTKLAGGTGQLFTILTTWIARGDPFFKDLTDETVRRNPLFYGLIANTAALLMMFPLLIGYLFFQKRFVESIERTGIVG
jgi:multiple sugar transport system permease protein